MRVAPDDVEVGLDVEFASSEVVSSGILFSNKELSSGIGLLGSESLQEVRVVIPVANKITITDELVERIRGFFF